jgi:MYXO-CTERM domain-containing protein
VPLTGTGNFATTDLNNPMNSLALSLAETGGGGGTGTVNATLAAIVPTLTPVMTITLLGLMLLAGVTVLRRRTAMQATR